MKFYLQKTGDPLLQPLESAKIQVLAEKYRILAQSYLTSGQGVDIIINYRHPVEPQHYKYHQQVNDEGNIIIMPPTQLHPGQWEIHCCSDLMSELIGESWQASLYLQVEAQDDLSTKIQDDQENLAINSTALAPCVPKTTVNLIWDVEAITRQWGDPVAIAGQIEIENSTEKIDCLQYEIVDPLTKDCLYQHKQPLNTQSSFLAFYHTLTLPNTITHPTLELIAQVLTVTGKSCDRKTLTIHTEIPEIKEETNQYLKYTIELSDLKTKASYIFDIAIEKPSHPLPIMVNLPDFQTSPKPLRRVQKSERFSLPPRLFDAQAVSCRLPLQLPIIS